MKNNFLILAFVTLSVFSSCSQDQGGEQRYSCSNLVDSWVKANMDDIRGMDRDSWENLPVQVSVAAYRAFTPNQKILFWQQKFKEVKKLPWNKQELQHIEKAENFLNANKNLFYSEKASNTDLDKIDTFFYLWQKYAEEVLKWDEAVIYSIVVSGYSVIDTKGTLKIKNQLVLNGGGSSSGGNNHSSGGGLECNCKKDHVLACAPAGPYCEESDCVETNRGCGWFFVADCNGRCGGL